MERCVSIRDWISLRRRRVNAAASEEWSLPRIVAWGVRRVTATFWPACIDGHVLGCWRGKNTAMAAAEWAALAPQTERDARAS